MNDYEVEVTTERGDVSYTQKDVFLSVRVRVKQDLRYTQLEAKLRLNPEKDYLESGWAFGASSYALGERYAYEETRIRPNGNVSVRTMAGTRYASPEEKASFEAWRNQYMRDAMQWRFFQWLHEACGLEETMFFSWEKVTHGVDAVVELLRALRFTQADWDGIQAAATADYERWVRTVTEEHEAPEEVRKRQQDEAARKARVAAYMESTGRSR